MRKTERNYPDIPDQRRFTISQACDLCEVRAHVLRYWETLYKPLSRVERRGNRRYYSIENLITIRTINNLKDQGLNSQAIATALERDGKPETVRAQVLAADKIRAHIVKAIKLLE